MKFTANRKAMLAVFNAASRFTIARSTVDILRYVHCKALDGVFLTATNTEASVRIRLSCEVESPGEVLLDAAKVGKFLSLSSAETIAFETVASGLVVKSDGGKLNLPTVDTGKFPKPDFGGKSVATCKTADALAAALRMTTFACDNDDNRYTFSGVCVDTKADELNLVATDGKCMSTAIVATDGKCDVGIHLVPERSLRLAMTLLAGRDPVAVAASDSSVALSGNGWDVTMRMLEGRFPNWRQIIPDKSDAIRLPVKATVAAIQQAAIVCDQDNVRVELHATDGRLLVSAKTALGESSASVVLADQPERGPVAFDHRYLLDYLTKLNCETVEAVLADEKTCLFDAAEHGRCAVFPLPRITP